MKTHIQMQDLKTHKEQLLRPQKKNGMSLVRCALKILSKIQWNLLINQKLSDKAVTTNTLLVNLDLMEKLLELAKKLTILFMKVNSKMTSTMVMEDLFIQMETTTLEIGLMERDQVTESWLTNQVGCMKASGSTASLWEINDYIAFIFSFQNII